MTGAELGDKRGRPRRYDFKAPEGFASEAIGYSVSVLDELSERVIDQIDDLPPEAFAYRHPNVWFCLGWLPLHAARSELSQIQKLARRLTGTSLEVDDDLSAILAHGALDADGSVPAELQDAVVMVDAMRRVRTEITTPFCRTISDPNATLEGAETLSTPQNVLAHLFWHWTYHSGHIGLMRLEWGSDYEWVMASAPVT